MKKVSAFTTAYDHIEKLLINEAWYISDKKGSTHCWN